MAALVATISRCHFGLLGDRHRQIYGQAFVTRCGQSQAGNGVAISVMKGWFDDASREPCAERVDFAIVGVV
jgi:hypothetical protein